MVRNNFTVKSLSHLSWDTQTDCATRNQCISEVHDTIWIKAETYL